jgi:hypothetical protein
MPKKLDSVKWVRKKATTFESQSYPPLLAALLHIYFGSLTLDDIAGRTGITRLTLQDLRKNPRFFRYVDTFKKELAHEIIEDLLVNTYQLEEYDDLASDFSLFDEVFQMQIRVPLFSHLRKISDFIKSKTTHGLNIDTSEFMLFRRLFSFFILMEKYTPTLVSKSLKDMKQMAKDIVWPILALDKSEIERILSKPLLAKDERVRDLKMRLVSL